MNYKQRDVYVNMAGDLCSDKQVGLSLVYLSNKNTY